MPDTPQDHREVIDTVKGGYEERIRTLLDGASAALSEQGWERVGEVDHWSGDDEHVWEVSHDRTDGSPEAAVGLRFEIVTALSTTSAAGSDRPGRDPVRVNFALHLLPRHGRSGVVPYNHTSDVWVDARDADAVEERFRMVERVRPDDIAAAAAEDYRGRDLAQADGPEL